MPPPRLRLGRLQIDTSQVVINKQYGVDSGTAAEFYALFKDQGSAQTLINAFNSARVHAARRVVLLADAHVGDALTPQTRRR